ncbi:RdRP-domain-containing protein [Byssothecium circinans]|uniref:RNA-dependent RNA polymerase n=1 Tax=Byssothecium circinans TaxID=147558 RepID=A0A6A5TUW4_9PLEO|nr:RdRP-domain-containing protein [Byssothecium circinans]
MDVFVDNVPPRANHTELRLFLRDTLSSYDVLAYDIFKKVGNKWAILTLANESYGQMFLQAHGGPRPLKPLIFKKFQLSLKKSNKKGQPDMLRVRVLLEKEASIRAKKSKKGSGAKVTQPSKPLFPFDGFQTGIWNYDHLGKLIYDGKFKDQRQGTITFGHSALVVYLAASIHQDYGWHCRIDIPYSTIEHAIPSDENRTRGTITLTLRTPPKIYEIVSTDDLHLYSGREPAPETSMPSLDRLSLNRKDTKRLVRICKLASNYEKNSALCMVYKFTLPDVSSAQRIWIYISHSSALSQAQVWRAMVPSRMTDRIEDEFNRLDKVLSYWDPISTQAFTFDIRFQILALVFEGTVSPGLMFQLLGRIWALSTKYTAVNTARAVRRLGYQLPTPGPDVGAEKLSIDHIADMIEDNIQAIRNAEATSRDLVAKQGQHDHLVSTYKAIITPTGTLLRGPDWNVSNRILRKYAQQSEYFMRVFFADEDGMSVLHDPRAEQTAVYARFRKVLDEGIMIAGRHYSFLGFSHSSLRCHTAWFMAPFIQNNKLLHAKDIIEDLGDFSHIRCSAKCAARIGQAFSDTIFAVPIPNDAHVVETEPDIERNEHCFSDGCGTISQELLEEIWKALPPERRKLRPTILQVRYRGAKGVLSLDSRLPGKQLIVRKSMTKYTARESWRDLEICGASYKPLRMFLNQQFIKILEDLRIPVENIVSVQKEALQTLELIIRHPINAASFLEYSYSGVAAKMPSLLTLMHKIGISFQEDPFLTDIIEVAAMSSLRDMKYRARIPIEKGYLLYGIMDETNELKEGEVYIITGSQDDGGRWRRRKLIGDRVVVTRAPALHPGDVQVVKAVDVSESSPLHGLYNCVVFSQQGSRDLPSMLGGGDLDGDQFHIMYDERLIPPITYPPSEYPPISAQDLGRPAQVSDITEFFVQYMNSDRLGQISNKHKIRADRHPEGTLHPDCITLAKLASDAVDFSKSGKPVDMNDVPKGADMVRPDFMASGPGLVINKAGAAELAEEDIDDIDDPDSINVLDPDKFTVRYYKSPKTLGVLYRNIDEANFFSRMKNDFQNAQSLRGSETLVQKLERYIDRETRIFQWEQHRGFAEELRECYEENMLVIMDSLRPHRGKPLTELEVFSGNILGKKERASTRYLREANMEVRERFNRDVSSFIRRIRTGDGLGDEENEAFPRAIACFKIALETRGWENYSHLKSWKYVAAAVCLEQLYKVNFSKMRPL